MNEEKPATVEDAITVQDSQSPKDSTSTAYQPIDFSEFAISQNFGSQLKVTKRLTKVPVYKPKIPNGSGFILNISWTCCY